MSIKLIGIKEFRANISDYAKKARKEGVRFVIMNRNTPLFELKPFEKGVELENIFADIAEGLEAAERGRVYSQEDILAQFSE